MVTVITRRGVIFSIFYIIYGPKTDKLYPSAPLIENINLEKRLEKKINDGNSFNNHISNT